MCARKKLDKLRYECMIGPDLTSDVTSHHFWYTLLIINESLGSVHTQGARTTGGRDHWEPFPDYYTDHLFTHRLSNGFYGLLVHLYFVNWCSYGSSVLIHIFPNLGIVLTGLTKRMHLEFNSEPFKAVCRHLMFIKGSLAANFLKKDYPQSSQRPRDIDTCIGLLNIRMRNCKWFGSLLKIILVVSSILIILKISQNHHLRHNLLT